MSLSLADHINLFESGNIYLETTESLANRADFAWLAYQTPSVNKNIKDKALEFLSFAFDIRPHESNKLEIIAYLMAKREKYKSKNPNYLPGKVPHHVGFHPGKLLMHQTIKHGESTIADLKTAIGVHELLDVHNFDKASDKTTGTLFFASQQRKEFHVHIHCGRFKKNGILFDTSGMESHEKKGFASFTLNIEGELSLFSHTGGDDSICHSTLNSGMPIVSAGEIKIENGILKAITSYSGHYLPSLFNIYRTLEYFSKNGIEISQAKVMIFNNPNWLLPSVRPEVQGKFFSIDAEQIYTLKNTKRRMNVELDCCIEEIQDKIKQHMDEKSVSQEEKSYLTGSGTSHIVEFARDLFEFRNKLERLTPFTVNEFKWKVHELKLIVSLYEQKHIDLADKDNKKETHRHLTDLFRIFKEQVRHKSFEKIEFENSYRLKNMKTLN